MLLITLETKHQSRKLSRLKWLKQTIWLKFKNLDLNSNWLMGDLNCQWSSTMLQKWNGLLMLLNSNLKVLMEITILSPNFSKSKQRFIISLLYLSLRLKDGTILKNIKLTLDSLLNSINMTQAHTLLSIFKSTLNFSATKIRFNGHKHYSSPFKKMTRSHTPLMPITSRKFKDIK